MSRHPDRRAFLGELLKRSAGTTALLIAPTLGCSKRESAAKPATQSAPRKPSPPLPPPRAVSAGTLIGPGRREDPASKHRAHYLALLDLDAPSGSSRAEVRRIPTLFFGHGLAFRPDAPHIAVLFQKKGPGCCEVDLRDGKVTRTITTIPSRHFYGHGVFSADGKQLFCTEAVVGDASYKGVIAVRDGRTYELLGTFDSHGHAPHDLHLRDGGKTLVVTNGGGTLAANEVPNVAWLDIAGRALKKRVLFDSPRVNAGHVALDSEGLAVVSAPRDGMDRTKPGWVGGVSFLATDQQSLHTSTHQVASKLRGEVLSVAIDPQTGIAATTCPDGGLLAFWDVKTGALLASKELADARGVALTMDGQWFAVTHGKDAVVSMYGSRTLGARGKPRASWMSGSHVVIAALT